MNEVSVPPRMRRTSGKQARLTREKIIEETLLLLQDMEPKDLTMAAIAERFGATTMALYKHFQNREALLDAVAEHTIGLFEAPMPAQGTWQQRLLVWLKALQQHLERYPNLMKLAGRDGKVTGAWVRLVAPVAQLLSEQGLRGERLAFILSWFMSDAVGFLNTEVSAAPAYRQKHSLGGLDGLSHAEQEAFISLMPHLPTIDRQAMLDFALQQMVVHLEHVLAAELK